MWKNEKYKRFKFLTTGTSIVKKKKRLMLNNNTYAGGEKMKGIHLVSLKN